MSSDLRVFPLKKRSRLYFLYRMIIFTLAALATQIFWKKKRERSRGKRSAFYSETLDLKLRLKSKKSFAILSSQRQTGIAGGRRPEQRSKKTRKSNRLKN